MEFLRENIVKIIFFIVIFVIAILVFTFIFRGEKLAPTPTSYTSMEENLLNSSKKYVDRNRNLLPKGEEVAKVKMDTLISAGYIKEMSALEDENVKCTGYTEILIKGKKYLFIPYLKCGKYYETRTMTEYLKENVEIVTSGDGLYQDGDEYIYRGEHPKNYILLGDRLYRIVSIDSDDTIRLISYRRIDTSTVWDDRYNINKNDTVGINDYSKSRLKETLNDLYYDNDIELEEHVFSEQEIDKIIPHDVCTGKRSFSDKTISKNLDCQSVEQDQMIGLSYVSDYSRASIDPNCKTLEDKACMNYNYYSYMGSSFRTTNAITDNSYMVLGVDSGVMYATRASNSFNLRITVYIDKLSLYASGTGSYDDPYRVR